MSVMDSPLNSAHQQERRAEALLSCGQFADAIHCHQKAAEYLLEAMGMTQVAQALVSIQLQYESHLRQQKVLKDKWRRYELQQEKIQLEKANRLKEKQRRKSSDASPCKEQEQRKLSEGTKESLGTSSLVISAENFSVSSLSSSSEFLTSKDQKDGANYLEGQVHELQMQVLSLTQALEDSNRENTKLLRTIACMKDIMKERFDVDFDEEMVIKREDQGMAEYVELEVLCKTNPDMEDVKIQTENQSTRVLEPENNTLNCQVESLCCDPENTSDTSDRNASDCRDIPLPPIEMPDFSFEDNK